MRGSRGAIALATFYLGLPGLLLSILGYYRTGTNSCEWHGEKFECWLLYGEPAQYFAIGAALLIGFSAVLFFAIRRWEP